MIPAPGSNDWKRRVLRQQAALEHGNAAAARAKAAAAPSDWERDILLECAAEADYLGLVLLAVAEAIWPPERGMDLGPVLQALEGRADEHEHS